MIESTARAERFDLQTSTSSFYLWEVPQKPVAVRIPFNVMDRLEREAVEAFRSLSSRGSEIGGLLLGDVTAANPLVVSVADYELIACDYARGPLYRLAEADMERYQRAMEQRKSSGVTVAGFFRSHTRKGITLDVDDLAFFQACFREAHHIALLVRPFATKASTAGIFIWEAGKIHGEASYLEFPFRSSELSGKTADPEAKAPPAPGAPLVQPPKPPVRAQIVPIASRREVSMTPAPAAEPVAPAPAPTPVSAPPPPVAAAPAPAPLAPKVEEKPVPPQQAPNKNDKFAKKDNPPPQAKAVVPAKPAVKPAEPVKPAPKTAELVKPAETAKPAEVAKTVEAPKPAKTPEPAKAPEPAKSTEVATKSKELAKPVELEPVVEVVPRSGKGFKLVLAAATTVILFVLLFVYPGVLRHSTKAPTVPGGDSSPLQLRVERANGELLLTWNRDSDAIRNATKAVLQISDGDQHDNVDMDMTQLRNNGSIVYSPSSSDVSFRMEVIGRDQSKTTSESVRVLRTRPSPLDGTQPAPDNKSPAAVPPQTPATKAPGTDTPTAAATATPEQAAPAPVQQEEAPRPVVAKKAFAPESLSSRLRPAQSNDIPDAPTVGGSPAAPIPGLNLGNVGATPRPVAPPPTTSPAAPPAPIDPKNAKQGGQIQQALLITRKEPEYPKIAKQTGAKGIVTLSATIGKDGKLKNIKVVSGHPMLQNAAIEAVKQWLYRPTLLNGIAVETDTQIQLNFVGDR